MINQPVTLDLLTEARQTLLKSLAPELAGEQKYELLMVANAVGMAIRELEQLGQGQTEVTDRAVQTFLAERSLESTAGEAEADLAQAIRERRVDGADPALYTVLETLTEARLRVNNPGYLNR